MIIDAIKKILHFRDCVYCRTGYRRLLYISLIVIIVRSFYISWTQQPWTLLPVEFICGNLLFLFIAIVWFMQLNSKFL
jgi:F0F1-type ATP synthase assembly protein I